MKRCNRKEIVAKINHISKDIWSIKNEWLNVDWTSWGGENFTRALKEKQDFLIEKKRNGIVR